MAVEKRPAEETETTVVKKLNNSFSHDEIVSFLNNKIFEKEFQENLRLDISQSQPFRWGTVTELINDELLRSVRTEILGEIAFTRH